MPNDDEKKHGFEEDTDAAFTLPKPTPELSRDDADARADGKVADSAIDDMEVEISEDEVEAESESPGRKY